MNEILKYKHLEKKTSNKNEKSFIEDDDGNSVDLRSETMTFTILLIEIWLI